jgi:hypothetical protein
MNVANIFTFGLSQLFGLFLFVFAIVLFSRKDYYCDLFLNMKDDNPVIVLAATLGLFLGIILIGLHGSLVFHYKLVITILCWLIFIKSLFWLMLPEKMLLLTKQIFRGRGFYVLVTMLFIFGFVLIFRGSEIFIIKFG